MSPCIPQSANNDRAVILPVHVVPRAAKNEIVSVEGETLKVRVKAPPVKGKANEALVKLLAKTLGLRTDQVEIVSGRTARRKMVRVKGTDENTILDLFRRWQAKR